MKSWKSSKRGLYSMLAVGIGVVTVTCGVPEDGDARGGAQRVRRETASNAIAGYTLPSAAGTEACSTSYGPACDSSSGASDACVVACHSAPKSGDDVWGVLWNDNPTCQDVLGAGYFETRITPGSSTWPSGSATLYGAQTVSYTGSGTGGSPGPNIDWSSTAPIDAVIVKGGNAANVYYYTPDGDTADTGLGTPFINNGSQPGISHVNFCWRYHVTVSKTVVPTFTRTFPWTIDKSATHNSGAIPDPVVLSAGQTYDVDYSVAVTKGTAVDSNWAVSGVITIVNPSPSGTAIIDGITDTLSGSSPPTVSIADCSVGTSGITVPTASTPYTLAAGATMTCNYQSATYSSAPAAGLTNSVSVSTTSASAVGDGSYTSAAISFTTPSTVANDCVDVTDTLQGTLGNTCVSHTYTYTRTIGPYTAEQCGAHDHDNTATFTSTSDSTNTGNDSVLINVSVPCANGCTLTQGYWKTHFEGRKYDAAWATVGGPGAMFFSSGQSYIQVLLTPPQGNVYYILADQYIAATLNKNDGASVPSAVQTCLTIATTYFSNPVNLSRTARNTLLSCATTLDNYNNGLTGPGHCSE